jgi:hypothetical protein
MFHVSDLNNKYDYDFTVNNNQLSEHLDKKDLFQGVAFIVLIMKSNEWPWDTLTTTDSTKNSNNVDAKDDEIKIVLLF